MGREAHLLGEIVLPRHTALDIMVVLIPLPIALAFHELGRRIEDMGRGHQGTGLLGQAAGLLVGRVDRIGLGRGRQMDDGMGQSQLAFRRTEALIGARGFRCDHQTGRVCQTNLL